MLKITSYWGCTLVCIIGVSSVPEFIHKVPLITWLLWLTFPSRAFVCKYLIIWWSRGDALYLQKQNLYFVIGYFNWAPDCLWTIKEEPQNDLIISFNRPSSISIGIFYFWNYGRHYITPVGVVATLCARSAPYLRWEDAIRRTGIQRVWVLGGHISRECDDSAILGHFLYLLIKTSELFRLITLILGAAVRWLKFN